MDNLLDSWESVPAAAALYSRGVTLDAKGMHTSCTSEDTWDAILHMERDKQERASCLYERCRDQEKSAVY
jgi:hypothetical protein